MSLKVTRGSKWSRESKSPSEGWMRRCVLQMGPGDRMFHFTLALVLICSRKREWERASSWYVTGHQNLVAEKQGEASHAKRRTDQADSYYSLWHTNLKMRSQTGYRSTWAEKKNALPFYKRRQGQFEAKWIFLFFFLLSFFSLFLLLHLIWSVEREGEREKEKEERKEGCFTLF